MASSLAILPASGYYIEESTTHGRLFDVKALPSIVLAALIAASPAMAQDILTASDFFKGVFERYASIKDYEAAVEVKAGDQLMAYVAADQPFVLDAAGDGRGSEPDPNAPVATPDTSTAPPVDNSGLPVLSGVKGQTAADYTCSIANN